MPRRNNRFTIVLCDLEYDLLNRLATHHCRNRSDLIRWLIHMNGEQEGIFRRPLAEIQAEQKNPHSPKEI